MQAKHTKESPLQKRSPFMRRMLLLVACILLLRGMDTLLSDGLRYQMEDSRYERVAQCYAPACSVPPDTGEPSQPALLDVDFAALQSTYPDTVAWLTIDGTNISYPILQGQDNSYYLTHAVDGTQTKSGALFLDCRCAQADPYWIVYGHNMKDRSMFGSLRELRQQSTYQQAGGGLTLYLPGHIWRYQIFSVRVVAPEDETFLPRPQQDSIYAAFLDTVKANALYDTGIGCTPADSVLVLSTCTGTDGAQRLVLYARRDKEISAP